MNRILHVDGDSFFASCEVALDEKLQGRAVWVGGGRSGDGIVIAANRAAKKFGVKTGMACFEAKRLCPRGDPADSPDLKPLNETIAVELRDYGVRQLAVVGPQYPAGAHGHLVENGHEVVSHGKRTGKRTEPKPFVRPAFDGTGAQQLAAMESVMGQAIRDLGGT